MESQLDIHFYIFFVDLERPDDLGHVIIEEADPKQFVENSLRLGGPPCCSMTGAMGVSLDGIPWNGDYDQFEKDGPWVPYYYMNAIFCAVEWLVAATALLEGAVTYETSPHDDEGSVRFFRSRKDEVHFIWREIEPELRRVPLHAFGALLLREGKKLLRFSQEVVADLDVRLTEPELSKKAIRTLQDLLREVQGWNLGKRVADLELALAIGSQEFTLERHWNNVLDLMQDYPPIVTEVYSVNKDKPVRFVTLRRDHLPEAGWCFVESFVSAIGKHGISWQNPFAKRKWKHYLERFEQSTDSVTLVLRTVRGR